MGRPLSSVISMVLLVVLAFSQIGLPFFHTEHLEHGRIIKPLSELPDGDTVEKHEEHCTVCSVDFHGKLYIKPVVWLTDDFHESARQLAVAEKLTWRDVVEQRHRGPPITG